MTSIRRTSLSRISEHRWETLLCSVLGAVLIAPSAQAAFPGSNGQIAFDSTRDGGAAEIYVMNADGSSPTRITDNTSTDKNAAWSASAAKIAFDSERTGGGDIYVMNADGTSQTRLTTSPFRDDDPAWSPDGTKIAFSSNRDGDEEIFVMNADGSNQTQLTVNGALIDGHASWSPDGTKIAFTSEREVEPEEVKIDVFVMDATGANQVSLTSERDRLVEDLRPSWSPDGTKIAFYSSGLDSPAVDPGIVVMNADGSGKANLTTVADDFGTPAWAPDGTKIAFESRRAGASEIFAMNANGSSVVNLTNTAGNDQRPDWAPIGDTDGDALPDTWETDGIDVDGDGTAELDLPAMGADPEHKDIFVEVDFMAGHRMADAQLAGVTAAFAAAPVGNPDGTAGITLHIDNGAGSIMDPVSGETWGSLSDQDSLSHQDVLGSDFTVGGNLRYDWSEFETRRQTNLLTVRRPAFHYVIAAHSGPNQRFAGISRGITASDFIVAMHENCVGTNPLATECTIDPEYAASTFMHELGHNLSLQHGGTDEDSRKPNYLSVMNYNFGWGLILFDNSFELDYSRFDLSLNERSLDEETGFGIDTGALTAFKTVFTCPNRTTRYRIALTTQHTDWNCDRSITGIGTVSSDVSGNGVTGQLSGPIDWNRIEFAGGGIGSLAPPPGVDDSLIDEPTPAELQASRDLLESGPTPPVDPQAPTSDPTDDAPPQTEFGKKPKNKLKGKKATYTFNSAEDGSTFECRLDKKPFKACTSPVKLKRLKRGKHSFEARAIDAAGNVDPSPAKDRFKVVR